MVKFLDYISNKLSPYSFQITVAIIVLIFSVISYFAYTQIMKKVNSPKTKFSDVANKGGRKNEIEIKFFYVDWCPHCKTAKPEWAAFCNEYNQKVINEYIINCDSNGTNCTNEEDANVSAMITEHKIQSFPTVILFKENERYDFDAKVSRSSLEQFIKSVTQE